jgi:hypothetical protein
MRRRHITFAPQTQQESGTPSSSQYQDATEAWSEDDNNEVGADETVCYSQRQLTQLVNENEHEAEETVDHSQRQETQRENENTQPPVREPVAVSVRGDISNAHQSWWIALQQEQLVAYTQQQQELFSQIGKVMETFLACTEEPERERLWALITFLQEREQELRYMLEARQAWESLVLAHEKRLAYLQTRAPPHP